MNTFDKFLKKPESPGLEVKQGRFEKFNLKENPFLPESFVNKDSTDNRINGSIFEAEIRKKEFKTIKDNFLKNPQGDPGHLRMGFIIDTSYVGRGNGKSAFLINLYREIDKEYCLDISNNVNKCFPVYLSPEPGGRTKTFSRFVDLLFNAIMESGVINNCLAIIRLKALMSIVPNLKPAEEFKDEDDLVQKMNSPGWLGEKRIDINKFNRETSKNQFLGGLPREFPLFKAAGMLTEKLSTQESFKEYYVELKKGQEKLEFMFSHMVHFFRAADFNGAFVLVDDFERIPDFQSARQKRDFAAELRNCLYDGFFTNTKLGFYNFILVLHAGVTRLIQDAWSESGMENRVPLTSPQVTPGHIIPFEKLKPGHAVLLLKRYLREYRIDSQKGNELSPFTEKAVNKIAEISELNAAKILKSAYYLLDRAADDDDIQVIDEPFVEKMNERGMFDPNSKKGIASAETTDLEKKAKGEQ
ncbi:MAG: hypothetical protein KAW12_19965 [Candidatus Aminicenantes bacterium]|nr:hypothetical protein [Candidatus Aminicenantes bacterium]